MIPTMVLRSKAFKAEKEGLVELITRYAHVHHSSHVDLNLLASVINQLFGTCIVMTFLRGTKETYVVSFIITRLLLAMN